MLRARLTAQLLAGPPARDPVAVAERLLAVQGQDPRGARLAVRARTEGLTAADVDRALTEERSLLITWLNRGTLHLVRSEDYPWLQALTTPPLLAQSSRRLAQEGVPPDDAERAIAEVERSLAADGPLNRDQLREARRHHGVRPRGRPWCTSSSRHRCAASSCAGRWWAGAHVRPGEGLAGRAEVRGPRQGARRARAPLSRGTRPASDRDLARWAGLPLRDARAGLSAIGTAATASSTKIRPEPADCPRRACSARTIRCSWAGPRASSCSGPISSS